MLKLDNPSFMQDGVLKTTPSSLVLNKRKIVKLYNLYNFGKRNFFSKSVLSKFQRSTGSIYIEHVFIFSD